MDYNKLADLLYPNVDGDINKLFAKYPKRELADGARVSRFAPSPTGYLHIGGLYQCMMHEMLTKVPTSQFFLRLEDTDQKREIEGAGDLLYKTLLKFDIHPTEGYRGNDGDLGNYGPYVQSKRLNIYKVFAKHLVTRGRAFPCFCDKFEDKNEIVAKREQEIEDNNNTIDHDVCRNLSYEEIENNISNGKPFALRLLSMGDPEKTIELNDLTKGKRVIRENGKDVVLIKANGIPVYAFAHAVDDTLMGTTIIARGEDWFQSVNAHIEIFEALGLPQIPYLHTPNLCKSEDGKKRKLSKRKDPEADTRYFLQDGYPVIAVKEYLLNLINSDFEEWRKNNPNLPYKEFPFAIEKISSGNPIFDMVKLNDVSKDCIARMSAKQVYDYVLAWAKEYDTNFANILESNTEFAIQTFNIDREVEKPRKDIFKWSMVREYYDYMFNKYENLNINLSDITNLNNELIYKIMYDYTSTFSADVDKTAWFDNVKVLAEKNNFATDNKLYKANPENFNGNTATFCNIIRYCITGKTNTPDLYSICCVLGNNELNNRLNILKDKLGL